MAGEPGLEMSGMATMTASGTHNCHPGTRESADGALYASGVTIDTPGTAHSLATAVTAACYLGCKQLGVGVTAHTFQQLCSLFQHFPSIE